MTYKELLLNVQARVQSALSGKLRSDRFCNGVRQLLKQYEDSRTPSAFAGNAPEDYSKLDGWDDMFTPEDARNLGAASDDGIDVLDDDDED